MKTNPSVDQTRPLLAALRHRGWIIGEAKDAHPQLPATVRRRYPALPADVREFLSSINRCCNQAEDSWFLTAEDYARHDDSEFRWNEYECMALDALHSQAERAVVTSFWDSHFPFMLAVRSDYDYLAIRLTPEGFGTIVHGYAPEWEQTTIVATSFSAFLEAFHDAATTSTINYPFEIFL